MNSRDRPARAGRQGKQELDTPATASGPRITAGAATVRAEFGRCDK
jgi:hypothetical protein